MSNYFSAISFDGVISALEHDGGITIARDQDAVSLPLETAIEVASETLLLMLEEKRLRNHRGESLAGYLGQGDEDDLRRILSRIGGPDLPTFTNCQTTT